MNNLFQFFINRLGERSTWIGIITLLSGLGINFSPESATVIESAGLALVGGILALTKDKNVVDAVQAALANLINNSAPVANPQTQLEKLQSLHAQVNGVLKD